MPVIVFHGDRDATVNPRNAEAVVTQSAGAAALTSHTEAGRIPGGHSFSRTLYATADGLKVISQGRTNPAWVATLAPWKRGAAYDPAKVAETLKSKPEMVHIILTGRNAHPTIVELADTVTEMRQVKHAYEKGVMAQRGIEY